MWTKQFEEFKVFTWINIAKVSEFDDIQVCIDHLKLWITYTVLKLLSEVNLEAQHLKMFGGHTILLHPILSFKKFTF